MPNPPPSAPHPVPRQARQNPSRLSWLKHYLALVGAIAAKDLRSDARGRHILATWSTFGLLMFIVFYITLNLSQIAFQTVAPSVLWIIFAPNRGIVSLYRTKAEIAKLLAENRRLAEENQELQNEINRMQEDPAYLEEKARKEYGLLKENEVLYIFKKK